MKHASQRLTKHKVSFKDYLKTVYLQEGKKIVNKQIPYEEFAHQLLIELRGLSDYNYIRL